MVPTQAQFDVLSTIHAWRASSPVHWRPRHVYGHQDRFATSLTYWWELRNIECDAWAVNYRLSLSSAECLSPPNPRFFLEPAALFVGGVKHAQLDRAFLQAHVALPELRKRWIKRPIISPEAEAATDWSSLGRAMRNLSPKLQRWTTKHSAGMCGVGKFLEIWNAEDPGCPLCGAFEDHEHVPRCPDSRAQKHWEHCIQLFIEWMDTHKTAPAIQEAILEILREIRQPPRSVPRLFPPAVASAFRSQRCIGCQGLLEGRLSSQWLPLQQSYLRSLHSRRSASLWASRMSQQLIQIGFSMWEHRNSIKHSDLSLQAQARIRQVDDAIHSQFDMGTADLPQASRRFLSCGRQQVLRKSLADKETWLKLLRGERRAHRRSLQSQRRILRDFCQRALVSADLPQANRRAPSSGRQQVLRKSRDAKATRLKKLRDERRAQRRSLQSQQRILRAFFTVPVPHHDTE